MSEQHIIILFVSVLIIAFISNKIESFLRKKRIKNHEKRMMLLRKETMEYDMKREKEKQKRSLDW